MRSVSAATAFAALIGSAGLAVGVAAGPAAASESSVKLHGYGGMVVDGAHRHVLIADRGQGAIVVTDYDGQLVGTVTGVPQASDLALSPDDSTLYVADLNGVTAVDTTKLAVSTTYDTGGGAAQVAVGGGRVWFSYWAAEDGQDVGDFGSFDPSAQDPAVTLGQRGDVSYQEPPLLAAGSGTLAAADPNPNVGKIALYDTSSGTPAVTAQRTELDVSALTASPDGTELLYTAYGEAKALSAADLSVLSAYPSSPEARGVAVAPDGTVAIGYNDGTLTGDDAVRVYTEGPDQPPSGYLLRTTWNLDQDGLAWAPDGGTLFAVARRWGSTTPELQIISEPRRYTATITLTAPDTAPRAKSLTVSGTLVAALPLPSGTPLTVTRTDLTSPKGKALPTVKTGADGAFSFKDTPTTGGTVTYKVAYAGDGVTYHSSSKSVSIAVSRSTPSLTLSGNHAVHAYGAHVTFTAHLGSTYSSSARTVKIYANPYGSDKPNKLVKEGKVNSKGDLAVTLTLTRDTTVEAVYAGDAHYNARTVKVTAYDKVKLSTKVSKDYKKARIGSHTYYWFHKSTHPVATGTMTYYKGRYARFELEQYYSGSWHVIGYEYDKLSSKGVATSKIPAPGFSGVKARVRMSYENASSGDNVNTTTYGSWEYLYFSS
jgi:hypothetical protein